MVAMRRRRFLEASLAATAGCLLDPASLTRVLAHSSCDDGPPGELLRTIMRVSGQMLFFTAGEKEVRTWMIRQGCTAVEAAGGIHTDLAKGFIRAEVVAWDALLEAGSEARARERGQLRLEGRDYEVQDGDCLNIRFNK